MYEGDGTIIVDALSGYQGQEDKAQMGMAVRCLTPVAKARACGVWNDTVVSSRSWTGSDGVRGSFNCTTTKSVYPATADDTLLVKFR